MAVYAVDALGLYPETATNLLLVMLGSNLAGRFIFRYISERIAPMNTMIPLRPFCGSNSLIWISAATFNITLHRRLHLQPLRVATLDFVYSDNS